MSQPEKIRRTGTDNQGFRFLWDGQRLWVGGDTEDDWTHTYGKYTVTPDRVKLWHKLMFEGAPNAK